MVHPRVDIGAGTKIYQNVTIGYRNGQGPPTVGENCEIGSGASILGAIKIGNNVKVGAGAVVLEDIPDNSVAVGVPAKVIKQI